MKKKDKTLEIRVEGTKEEVDKIISEITEAVREINPELIPEVRYE